MASHITSSRDLDLELPVSFDYKCRYVTLDNGICALLIHDPAADKAGVGVSVGTGSYHNPDDVEGLAHFLEHMLFLGTEKYPGEESYMDFIKSNGGYRNAYTADTETVYYFSVKTDKLCEAVDRLAQFFIAPLFTVSATDREIHAIDNEFNRAKEAPIWKKHVILSALATPANPFHKFTIGNLATLGKVPAEDLRERLIAFFRAHYLPAAMKVVAISSHSLDDLERTFAASFAEVPQAPEGVEPLGLKTEREALARKDTVWFNTAKEIRTVVNPKKRMCILTWPLERGLDNYRLNPGRYITHLVGHEAEGSVVYELKKRGLVHSLTTYSLNDPRYSMFNCEIELTDEGWTKKEEVVLAVFEYIDMMRKAGPQEWVFNEISGSSKAMFMCLPKRDSDTSAMIYASNLGRYAVEDVFYCEYTLDNWDPVIIKRNMDYLTPENCIILYSSPEYKDTLTDTLPHFDIPYTISPISPAFLDRLRNATNAAGVYHLPAPNPYIPSPESLSLKEPLTEKGSAAPFRAPRAVYTTPQSVFYHKQDRAFGTPKVFFSLGVYPRAGGVTVRDKAAATLANELVKDAFMAWAYQAEVAMINYDVTFSADEPLTVRIESYNDKFALFSKRLLSEIRTFAPSKDRFDVIKEKCVMQMESSFVNTTGTTIAKNILHDCIKREECLTAKVLAALKASTLEDVAAWLTSFWASGVRIAGHLQGAISEAAAQEFAADVERTLDAPVASEIRRKAAGSIPAAAAGSPLVVDVEVPNEKETNSCVYDAFEVGRVVTCPGELRDALCANLLADLLEPAAFKTLRTDEQLGYLVWAMGSTVSGVKYINFIVMSASHPPRYVDERIEAFIEGYGKTLREMPAEEFEEKKSGFISKLRENHKSLREEFLAMKGEFFNGTFLWHRKEITTKITMGITKEDVLAMYERDILNRSTRRKLSVQLHARPHKDEKIELCDLRDPECNYTEFAKEWKAFEPCPNPFFPDEKNVAVNLDDYK